jgi:hypothetical protein
VLAYAAAGLALLDLAYGVAGGIAAIVFPVVGAFLGRFALQRGAPMTFSLGAVLANVGALIVVLVAIVVFGGS